MQRATKPLTATPTWHVFAMLLITGILAACFTAIKAGLDYAPPLYFGAFRAMVGGGALLAFVRVTHAPVLPPKSAMPGLLLLSVVATTLTFAAMFLSPGRTEAGIASAAGNLQPFITLVLAAVFLGEALTPGKTAAMALGLGGVTLISYPALTDSGALGISGVMLALAVSLGSSLGSVLVKRMQLGRFLLAVTAWQLVIGGLLLLVIASVLEDAAQLDFGPAFIALLLFLALLGTALTTGLWYTLVQAGEIGRLATFFYLVPIFGLAIATIAFDEDVTRMTIAGVLAILLAVGLVSSRPGDRPQVEHHASV